MGKAARWFKGLFGSKKQKHADSQTTTDKDKRRWSFGAKPTPKPPTPTSDAAWLRSYIAGSGAEQNKHAIAVAAATAAAADAAVAAAQAAVAVVRLTSQGAAGAGAGKRDRWAANKIQAVFRGYLARKALRALKGLVKIQALVRGFLVRKRAAATLHSMQALIRAQTAVRTQRARRSFNKENRFLPELPPLKSSTTTEFEFHSKRLSSGTYCYDNDFDESPKIVEIDTFRPRSRSRRFSAALSECCAGEECRPIAVPDCRDCFDWRCECRFPITAHSTPRFGVAAPWACNGPATPAKSVCGETALFYGRPGPNYMASTESFAAKLRSQSAPRQRLEPGPGPKRRLSLNEILAARNSVSSVRMHRSYAHFQDQVFN